MAARVIVVELMTRNKALPGDSQDYHLFIYFFISLFNKKQEYVLGYSFPSGIFGPNLSRGRSRRMMDKQHLQT